MMYQSILFVCAALVASAAARAQDDEPDYSDITKTKTATATATRRSSMSTAATLMLNKIDQARQAIAAGNKPEALLQVNGAVTLANQIQMMSGPRAQMFPIYQELEEVTTTPSGTG